MNKKTHYIVGVMLALCAVPMYAGKSVHDLVRKGLLGDYGNYIRDLPTHSLVVINQSGVKVKIKLFYKTDAKNRQPQELQKYWDRFQKTDDYKVGLKLRLANNYSTFTGRTPHNDYAGGLVVTGALFDRIEITPIDAEARVKKIFSDKDTMVIRPRDRDQQIFTYEGRLRAPYFVLRPASEPAAKFTLTPTNERGFKDFLIRSIKSKIKGAKEVKKFQAPPVDLVYAEAVEHQTLPPLRANGNGNGTVPRSASSSSSSTASEEDDNGFKAWVDYFGSLLSPRAGQETAPALEQTGASGSQSWYDYLTTSRPNAVNPEDAE